ncbi:hypothetical protein Tco_0156788 [Tanacetum coccineum]
MEDILRLLSPHYMMMSNDELFDLETVNDNVYDDPFDSKEDKIKESKLLIDELDPPSKDCPGFLKSLVLAVFVLRSLELHILSFILGIQYPNLID